MCVGVLACVCGWVLTLMLALYEDTFDHLGQGTEHETMSILGCS